MQVKHMRASFDRKVLFILMNSFSTSEDTKAFLAQKHPELLGEPYIELMQNSSPKVDVATLLPASYPEHPDNEWCPPGGCQSIGWVARRASSVFSGLFNTAYGIIPHTYQGLSGLATHMDASVPAFELRCLCLCIT